MKRSRDPSPPPVDSSSSYPSVYSPLSSSLFPPSIPKVPLANSKNFVESLILDLLPPSVNGQANFNSKLRNRPILLENPVKVKGALATVHDRNRSLKKRKLKQMSRAQKKSSGLFAIDPTVCKWENFIPLHELWIRYIGELLGDQPTAKFQRIAERLVKADYHGSIMKIKASRNPSLIGFEGIIIQETQETFKFVTRNNELKIIPKAKNIFEFSIPGGFSFELFGDHIQYRASERSVKKFKPKLTIEI